MDGLNTLESLKRRSANIQQRKAQAEARKQAAEEQLKQVMADAKEAGVEDIKKLPELIAAAEKELELAKGDYEAKLQEAEQEVAKYEAS